MPLLRFDKVSLAYGHRSLLEHAQLEIHRGERVCLVGRNGEGKSSLIRLLSREATPDDGSIWVRPGTRIAHLAQEVSPDSDESVFDIVAGGLGELGELISQYHESSRRWKRSNRNCRRRPALATFINIQVMPFQPHSRD